MRLTVIIPAAGSSVRFGREDKLAQDLGGRPLLVRTVELFAKRQEVNQIIVAGPADDFESFRDRFGATLGFHGATVIKGSKNARSETVHLALASVQSDATHIAVHDAARPCASDEMLDRLFAAARTMPAVIVGVPATSTLKRVTSESKDVSDPDDDGSIDHILGGEGRTIASARSIVETVDRQDVVLAQTPQVFEASVLKNAYNEASAEGMTDDAAVVSAHGITVQVVEGDARNIKVTTQADLALARAILNVQPPKDRPAHLTF